MKLLIYISTLVAFQAQASSYNKLVQERAEVVETITRAANAVGVPPSLMIAIAWAESSMRARIPLKMDGRTPSYGTFQIKLETAQHVDKVYKHKHQVTPERLEVTYLNAFYACKYMKLLIKQHDGDLRAAVDAYNKGHLVSRNSEYVKKVLGHEK